MLTPMNVIGVLQRTPPAPSPGAVVALLKPVTWFPPMWALACGVVASGESLRGHAGLVIAGMLLAGPLVCGASQAVNDWYDRDVDAVNEPGRPIPSGRVPGRWGLWIAIAWAGLSLAVGASLGMWPAVATATGLALGWAYSAPPIRLKRNGWWGNAAVGVSYEGLAWLTGASLIAASGRPALASIILAALYSIGTHGIMTLNDFKSVRGDRAMGIRSLPAQLGEDAAARVACAVMLVPQCVVMGLLVRWGSVSHALAIAGLVLVQVPMMLRFVRHPSRQALWYSAAGVPLFVLGMMVSAFALRALGGQS